MNTERKNFIVIDEKFTCKNCGEKNPKHGASCRNHCRKCLYSKHIDETIPGDRKSDCKGLMAPIYSIFDSKKGQVIVQKCLKCGKTSLNKIADDDNLELLTKLLNANPEAADELTRNRRNNA